MLTKKQETFDELKKESTNKNPKNIQIIKETPTVKKTPETMNQEGQKRKGPTTRITIKYDVGFSNAVYLRGKGANLSWDKGIMLKNYKPDEWSWETDLPFASCEFKVLINDRQYELGENHTVQCGASIQYTPKFSF